MEPVTSPKSWQPASGAATPAIQATNKARRVAGREDNRGIGAPRTDGTAPTRVGPEPCSRLPLPVQGAAACRLRLLQRAGRARRLAPRRLDLLQRAASRLRHADDDPDETDGEERGAELAGVDPAERNPHRQEKPADQERRPPVARRRGRLSRAAHLARIDLVDAGPGDRAEGERGRD